MPAEPEKNRKFPHFFARKKLSKNLGGEKYFRRKKNVHERAVKEALSKIVKNKTNNFGK